MDLDKRSFEAYFRRQITVPSFGTEGQRRLSRSSCLVVGCGGLGCPAAQYLSSSGVGRIGLCDYDLVEYGNLSRQVLFGLDDVGRNKAAAARDALCAGNPHLDCRPCEELLSEANVCGLISGYDLVLDCTDNFHAKYLVHDACLHLGVDLVQAAIIQKHGQTMGFAFSRYGQDDRFGGCMRCLWDVEPQAACTQSCAEAGVLSIVAGATALQQTAIALQFLLGQYTQSGIQHLYSFSTLGWDSVPIPCSVACACRQGTVPEIGTVPLEVLRIPDASWQVLDVRNERDQTVHAAHVHYTVRPVRDGERQDLPALARSLDTKTHYVLACYAGRRSLDMARVLRSHGVQAYSLVKGHDNLQAPESPDRPPQNS